MGAKDGCGCCSCLCGCLFSCLISLVLQILFTVLVIVALAGFIFWLIFRPNEIKFRVTDASLTQFNFTANDNTLHYNLALNVSIRNPNKRIGIYYDRIEANAYFGGQRFDTETVTPFYQGHKNTTVISPVFKGQQLLTLGGSEVFNFDSEKADGVFGITVRLNLRIRPKLSWIKIGHFKPKIKCGLKVPLTSNGKSPTGAFESTKCSLDF
ncbi:NDR1/HIN1-like protein 10 [Juglans microcarpa x Juglans regia]|uniref:NDR1/HIN1-like protein 10 n=1 Tax=Juglans microcarpa x Juglans regia TaxID=2249226 RepID=UPI001B7F1780|nr:NDR1/HIN1-like protein 10 [Juglans microcarpa x Juglans regia]